MLKTRTYVSKSANLWPRALQLASITALTILSAAGQTSRPPYLLNWNAHWRSRNPSRGQLDRGGSGGAIRHTKIHSIRVYQSRPADAVDHFRSLTIHRYRNRRIDRLQRVSWKRLAGIDTGNSGTETGGFHDQDLAGFGGLCRRDGREVCM